jgi:hypothetical protein
VHNFSAGDSIQNKLLCPDHHLDIPGIWTKQFLKGTNIGYNNLHASLDFGDGVLMPKVAKKSEFSGPANVGWLKMETWGCDWVVIGSRKFGETENFWQQRPDQIFSFTSSFFFLDRFFMAGTPNIVAIYC